jgi:hypothetical protein
MSEPFNWGQKSRPTSNDPDVLADAIEDFVARRRNVTFVELQNWLGPQSCGDRTMTDSRDANLIYWQGMAKPVVDALNLLIRKNRIEFKTSGPLVYLFDGGGIQLPIAKRPPRAGYAHPRWRPVVLNIPREKRAC